jgi:hypothetical protein
LLTPTIQCSRKPSTLLLLKLQVRHQLLHVTPASLEHQHTITGKSQKQCLAVLMIGTGAQPLLSV